MDKQNDVHEAELKRPSDATKDLEPDEGETEQVKGGSFAYGAGGGGGAGLELKIDGTDG
jgi:hypothetical protein